MHTSIVNRPRTISITQGLARSKQVYLTSETKEIVASKDIVYGSESFSLEDAIKALNKISKSKEISPALRIALSTYTPEIESNIIILPVENSYQEDALKNLKGFIINILKKELRNKNVEFTTRLIKEKESVKLYLTDKDKLERLVENNPSVIKFIQTFGLELK